jgi:transposase
VARLIPPARRDGRRRSVDVRDMLNAIFYVLSTGFQWKAMPKDLPPKSTAPPHTTYRSILSSAFMLGWKRQ